MAAKAGVKHKVFCGSMCDVMDDEAPEGERKKLWNLVNATPNLIWQLLTKRPQRYTRELPHRFVHRNVWLGVSAENQATYNLRWPVLSWHKYCRGYTVFISYEPALGPVSTLEANQHEKYGFPDWLICGGESGPVQRPMEVEWAEHISRECEENKVAFFMKQMAERNPFEGTS